MHKAKPENQVLRGHQQERSDDTDLDRSMRLFARCTHEILIKNEALDAEYSQISANEPIRKVVPC